MWLHGGRTENGVWLAESHLKKHVRAFFWAFWGVAYQGAFKNTQNFLQKPTSKKKSKFQEEKTFFYIYMSFFLKVLSRFLAFSWHGEFKNTKNNRAPFCDFL
jgi:hypothetical protein